VPTEPREIVQRYDDLLNRQDWDALDAFLHPDYVEEYPQSGERIRGLANVRAVLTNYPRADEMGDISTVAVVGGEEQWAMTPMFRVVRVEGSDDAFTGMSQSRYPDGSTWHIVAVVKMREGKMWRSTTFFAQEFPAPDWRSQWVERIEPSTA
jgi:hypothetical protein